MARTYRNYLPGDHRPDGKAQSMRGLDACPPREFRRARATKVERAAFHAIERTALRVIDADELPAFGRARMPWFT